MVCIVDLAGGLERERVSWALVNACCLLAGSDQETGAKTKRQNEKQWLPTGDA